MVATNQLTISYSLKMMNREEPVRGSSRKRLITFQNMRGTMAAVQAYVVLVNKRQMKK